MTNGNRNTIFVPGRSNFIDTKRRSYVNVNMTENERVSPVANQSQVALPSQPASTTSTGLILDIDAFKNIISKQGGDLINDKVQTKVEAFIMHPLTGMSLFIINKTTRNTSVPASILGAIYVSIAHVESDLSVLNNQKISSSHTEAGPLQLKKATYFDSLPIGRELIEAMNSSDKLKYNLFKYSLIHNHSWYANNHTHPFSNASEPEAMVGALFLTLRAVLSQWSFTGGRWNYFDRSNATARELVRVNQTTLSNYYSGIVFLMYVYWANGVNKIKKNDQDLKYLVGATKATTFFNQFIHIPNFTVLFSVAMKDISTAGSSTKGKLVGDVESIDPTTFSDISAFNVYVGSSLGLMKPWAATGVITILPDTATARHSFGYRAYKGKPHEGVDIRAQTPRPIFAVADGTISLVKMNSQGYGKTIILKAAFCV